VDCKKEVGPHYRVLATLVSLPPEALAKGGILLVTSKLRERRRIGRANNIKGLQVFPVASCSFDLRFFNGFFNGL